MTPFFAQINHTRTPHSIKKFSLGCSRTVWDCTVMWVSEWVSECGVALLQKIGHAITTRFHERATISRHRTVSLRHYTSVTDTAREVSCKWMNEWMNEWVCEWVSEWVMAMAVATPAANTLLLLLFDGYTTPPPTDLKSGPIIIKSLEYVIHYHV